MRDSLFEKCNGKAVVDQLSCRNTLSSELIGSANDCQNVDIVMDKQEQIILSRKICSCFRIIRKEIDYSVFLCSLPSLVSFRPLPVALLLSAGDLPVAVLNKCVSAERADPDLPLDFPLLSFLFCRDTICSLSNGKWENEAYGVYSLYAWAKVSDCIVLETSGGYILCNFESNDATAHLCTAIQELLANKNAGEGES